MRRANADIILSEYIDECRDRPFAWGKHDCLTFANNCTKAQIGDGALDDLVGKYDCATSALYQLRKRGKELGYNPSATIIDALDDRLKRLDTEYPPRGSITAKKTDEIETTTGWMLGVVMRRHSAFVSPAGLVFMDREPSDLFWSVA